MPTLWGKGKKYSNNGKAYCYSGNGFYVVNARGHLYGLGEPEDYGYYKTYNIEELTMFPDFKIFPCGKDTEELRRLISELIGRDDVDEIICATDAGCEGELIFSHIYEANRCTKPVKRLWCNSMTDEAIRVQLANFPPDSDFDGEYYAALARQKCDWIIGMNLSRLYGVLDNYPHHIGRVKTPVLSIIVQRDNEIQNFKKSVSYRLEMPNGALSETVYNCEWYQRERYNNTWHNWKRIDAGAVTKSTLNLGNVDNTADADKTVKAANSLISIARYSV